MLKKLALLSLSGVAAFAMHTFEININDKDLGVSGKLDMGQYNQHIEPGTTFVGAKALKGSTDHSDKKSDLNPYYELNFLKTRSVGGNGLELGMGVKANYTDNDSASYMTIPLGLEAIYTVPGHLAVPVVLSAKGYYAPEVLSMEDAKEYYEVVLNVRFEVIENGLIVLGYRDMNFGFQNAAGSTKRFNYNKSGYIGYKFAF